MWALIITLVIVGLLLMGVELLIIPGFGVTGILGIISFVGSGYLTFVNFGVTTGVLVIVAEIVLITAFVVLLLRSKTWKKLTLNTNIEAKVDDVPQSKGVDVGMTGVALTRMAPAGLAEIGDITLEVFSRDSIIDGGSKVEVVDIIDNKVIVKKII